MYGLVGVYGRRLDCVGRTTSHLSTHAILLSEIRLLLTAIDILASILSNTLSSTLLLSASLLVSGFHSF